MLDSVRLAALGAALTHAAPHPLAERSRGAQTAAGGPEGSDAGPPRHPVLRRGVPEAREPELRFPAQARQASRGLPRHQWVRTHDDIYDGDGVELTYDDVAAQCISTDIGVFKRVLDIGRVAIAADTLGAAQNMLDQAVAYAKQREQFNRPIGSSIKTVTR